MKKLMSIIAFVAISVTTLFAQITNVYPFTKDSLAKSIDGKDTTIQVTDRTLVIDRIYAGVLSGTMFSTDSLYASGFTGVRFGAMGTYRPAKWVSFSSWAMVQIDGGAHPWSLQQFYMTVNPIQKLTLQVGSMSTLPTEQRPHPVSGSGQFETWSHSQIPGGSLAVKVKYQFTKDFELASGIALRKNLPEYSARVTYKKVQLSGWYSQCDTTYGSALTLDFSRVYSTLVWKQKQVIADILVVTLSKKQGIKLYSDMGYDFVKKDLVRGEWGLLKTFDSKWIDGLFGLGYRHEAKSVVAYLFVHL